jgi:hypothetical protein
LLSVIYLFLIYGSCSEPVPPPDLTDNNTLEDAWNVELPYGNTVEVPADDDAEVFRFGISGTEVFAKMIIVNLELLEADGVGFYLDADLLSGAGTPLITDGRESDLVPSVWVCSHPHQTYYFRITPTGTLNGDRYSYSISISSSDINDPGEPDDDTANAQPISIGVETTGAYLVDAFSDSTVSSSSLADFYKFELDQAGLLYVKVSRLGGDCQPVLRLYNPYGELVEEVEDSIADFDISQSNYQPGWWFLEVNDQDGFYPSYGKGNIAFNYLKRYVLLVSKEPL